MGLKDDIANLTDLFDENIPDEENLAEESKTAISQNIARLETAITNAFENPAEEEEEEEEEEEDGDDPA